MPTISLRLDEDVKQWLDTVVAQKNLNASALIRGALEDKLREIDRGSKPRSNFPLSIKDRLILSNQFRTLAALYPDNNDDYLINAKIVEKGYEFNYGWMTDYIYEGFSRKQCIEALEILTLYSFLASSYEDLSDKDGLQKSDIFFLGFDENTESEYLAYAKFLLYDEKRFENLSNEAKRIPNSHFPSLSLHRQRLQRWKDKGESRKMSANAIRWVIDEPK